MGFCLGGRTSWLSAASLRDSISCCIAYHGGNIRRAMGGGERTPLETMQVSSAPEPSEPDLLQLRTSEKPEESCRTYPVIV